MTDTPKLIGPTSLTGSAATIYTVPVSTTFYLRSVEVCNETGSAATLTLSLGTDGAGKRLAKAFNVPANAVYAKSTMLPVAASTVIQAYSGTSGALTITIGGIEST